ncbi:RagB/SusD family nutrient uptake outer membrane protein [Flavihumibacter cheonanensis]|uniref:RagB/SusD family nutrient uptake outer membrane protein n=1 Tax=Flavihumibacter cheonanensis TaxID=1442385 RepID=UPI001EF8A05D|nr:RagB/SusD family nutrient uptake outer membrane protein [Flavihumibacter cheonanensis]MCG7754553.1 RagB/SusD family nutrient uptake outer membrane protein [Flavihumibacter cheonanensis]
MKKTIYISGLCLMLAATSGCSKFLDKQPIDSPASGAFLNNEKEINVSLNAAYRSYWDFGLVPYLSASDAWADIAILRANDLGEGTFDTYNTHSSGLWRQIYITIQRCNTILDGMVRAKGNTPDATYKRLEAEARVLRAYAYHHLAFLFNGAPLITKPLTPEEFYNQSRASKADLVKFVYDEIDAIAGSLNWAPTERGRVSRAVALGIKARTALYNGDYSMAAAAAKQVIDNAGLSLNPNYGDLFTRSGQKPNAGGEIMWEILYTDALATSRTNMPLGNCSRAAGGQSGRFPAQRLVDVFEASDGYRIDESAIYDPNNPRVNRDIRLKYTVAIPGDTVSMNLVNFVYDIYNPTTSFRNADGSWSVKTNADFNNAFGPAKSGVGYLWSKYTMTDENAFQSRVSYSLMRYAEILLTYAEAKIELGEVDESVITAINRLRTRAKLPNVRPEVEADINEMRELIRRERTAELAVEGFRWFDIRRWGIAELVMPGKVVGIAKDPNDMPGIPNFKKSPIHDLNSIPDYTDQLDKRYTRETRFWYPRLEFLPVPQAEIDINSGLSQNPGWE